MTHRRTQPSKQRKTFCGSSIAPRQDMIVPRHGGWKETRKLIASINIARNRESAQERWMFCWCLSSMEKHEQWKFSMYTGNSQLLFIYQITPDSFTIDKIVIRRCPCRHRSGWHNSWLRRVFLCFTSSPPGGPFGTQIHQCPGRLIGKSN